MKIFNPFISSNTECPNHKWQLTGFQSTLQVLHHPESECLKAFLGSTQGELWTGGVYCLLKISEKSQNLSVPAHQVSCVLDFSGTVFYPRVWSCKEKQGDWEIWQSLFKPSLYYIALQLLWKLLNICAQHLKISMPPNHPSMWLHSLPITNALLQVTVRAPDHRATFVGWPALSLFLILEPLFCTQQLPANSPDATSQWHTEPSVNLEWIPDCSSFVGNSAAETGLCRFQCTLWSEETKSKPTCNCWDNTRLFITLITFTGAWSLSVERSIAPGSLRLAASCPFHNFLQRSKCFVGNTQH